MSDYRSLIAIPTVEVSPKGGEAAFVTAASDFDKDITVSKLEIADLKNGRIRYLASDVADPHWSPDGKRIAFLRTVQGQQQLFVVNASGGISRQITRTRNGVEGYAWRPVDNEIALVTQDDRPAVTDHNDIFEIGDDGYLTNSPTEPSHLWIVSGNGGTPERVTEGKWSVLENPAPLVGGPSDPSWSPDGRWIAFARAANTHDSDSDLSRIAVANASTGEIRLLTDRSTYEYLPLFSPASPTIAYSRPHGPTPLSESDIYWTGITAGSADRDFSDALDRDVTGMQWMPDGKSMLLSANDGVTTGLWIVRTGGETQRLNLGDLCPSAESVGPNGDIALVASSSTSPTELYVYNSADSKPRRITHLNDHFAHFRYAKVEEFKWKSPDGEACDGVLTYPVGYRQGEKYPLVVFIHGGPEEASLASFLFFEGGILTQPLAAKGYVVFEPNYRGSDGLGNAHEHAIYGNPGDGPASDVMSGITALKSAGLVDPSQVSVAGHSYGGYLTSWLIGHYHKWKSAVVLDGLIDWKDLYDYSAAGNLAFTRDSLGGSPWNRGTAELYRSGSPISYATEITTPTLILSGTCDETVPITESYELYHAIKDNGTPVRFFGIPGAQHLPTDPVRLERFWSMTADWLTEHDPQLPGVSKSDSR